jgi:hypothetical protein
VVKQSYVTVRHRAIDRIYKPCKVNPNTWKKVYPKKPNKIECGVYLDQAVPVIPQLRIRCYSLK